MIVSRIDRSNASKTRTKYFLKEHEKWDIYYARSDHNPLDSMRIAVDQLSIMKTLSRRYFGEDAKLWLFGSRVDDEKKGGDYDFLIETSLTNPDEIISRKIDMIAQLQSSDPFEDEKIDIIIKRQQSSYDMPIYHIAKNEGVQI